MSLRINTSSNFTADTTQAGSTSTMDRNGWAILFRIEELHPRLHDRARLHGGAETRLREAELQNHRDQRRPVPITRSGRRTSRKRRATP